MAESAGTILVVDDNTKNLELCRVNLEMEDYAVLLAMNGAEGLRSARLNGPDLILLDIMMPELNGYEVIERLKADPETREIPVLMMTARSAVEDVLRAFELGAMDYIKKPYDVGELLARVATMVALKKGRDQLKRSIDREMYLGNLGRLAAGIGHDFYNILHIIIGSSEAAMHVLDRGVDCPVSHESVKKLLTNVIENGHLMSSMVTGLVTYARGEKQEAFAPRELKDLIESSIRIFNRKLRAFELQTRFEPVPAVLCSDRDMRQVFLNLLQNAIESTINKRERRIDIRLWREDGWARFAISDTGAGIRPEHMERIWENLFTTKEEGSGIGLATVRRIVENHNGRIEVESALDKGTTFTVSLPLNMETA